MKMKPAEERQIDEPAFDRITDAEESVVGSILFHGLCFNEVSDILEPDGSDFNDALLGKIYAAFFSSVVGRRVLVKREPRSRRNWSRPSRPLTALSKL